jgi:hypothetical protein
MTTLQDHQLANEAAVARGQAIVEDYRRDMGYVVSDQGGLIAVLTDLMHYAADNPDVEFDAALDDALALVETQQEADV